MTTYVLVHGAWTGAHGFRRLRPLLRAHGHEVLTPSLTGIGERVHLVSPRVDLSTHVRDVVNHVLYEDLRDVVLVGFSYGGMVVSGALEHIADRVRELVFLDAFAPDDGDCVMTLSGGPGRLPAQVGETWLLPPSVRQFDDPDEGAFQTARRTPQPVATFTEPVHLAQPLEAFGFGRTYIRATVPEPGTPATAFDRAADRARSSPDWDYREIATTHMVASNRPDELAAILLELGARRGGPTSGAQVGR